PVAHHPAIPRGDRRARRRPGAGGRGDGYSRARTISAPRRGDRGIPDRARVVWAGVAADDRLLRLREGIEAALVHEGFSADARPFKPHITLARTRREMPLPGALSTYCDHVFGSWDVDAVD